MLDPGRTKSFHINFTPFPREALIGRCDRRKIKIAIVNFLPACHALALGRLPHRAASLHFAAALLGLS
jgi:hypothetical protein